MSRCFPVCLALTLAACAGPQSPSHEPSHAAPASLDDAEARARAHAFFRAFDNSDKAALEAATTAGFVHYRFGRLATREDLLGGPRKRTRECAREVINRSDAAIVYTGDCVEHVPAKGDRPAYDLSGWSALVLVPERGAWKVALWQWAPSGIDGERAVWNLAYRNQTGFKKAPTDFLVSMVEGIEAGDALSLAMGQGRNALYLASQGWTVTGVDISDEGIRQARAAAERANLPLRAVLANSDDWDFGVETWDLITMIYAGSSTHDLERAKRAMRPGGLFVLEFFEKNHNEGGAGMGTDREALDAHFADWDIVVSESVNAPADWGAPGETYDIVRFAARKPK